MAYTVFIIIIFVIAVIGVIIGVIYLNRNNQINIIDQLPSYRISTVNDNTYWGLYNSIPKSADPNPPVTNKSYWFTQVSVGIDGNLNQWTFEPVSNAFVNVDSNTKFVRIVNKIIYDQSNFNDGFVQITPNPDRKLVLGIPAQAQIFIYQTLENNTFTLKTNDRNIIVDKNGMLTSSTIVNPEPATVFKLLPLLL